MLISDLGMPDMDGFELIKSVDSPSLTAVPIPAVALSAYTSESDCSKAFASDFRCTFGNQLKPWS
jgi:two-component system OmpR family sensor kinase